MNKVHIIGNVTKDPVLRSTPSGVAVCEFTVAVNRRGKDNTEADFFRVTAWRQLGENCHRYLQKGRKVAVVGAVSARAYQSTDGQCRASLEVIADDVEFLSPRDQEHEKEIEYRQQERMAIQRESGFTPVEPADLPF